MMSTLGCRPYSLLTPLASVFSQYVMLLPLFGKMSEAKMREERCLITSLARVCSHRESRWSRQKAQFDFPVLYRVQFLSTVPWLSLWCIVKILFSQKFCWKIYNPNKITTNWKIQFLFCKKVFLEGKSREQLFLKQWFILFVIVFKTFRGESIGEGESRLGEYSPCTPLSRKPEFEKFTA